MAVEYVVEYYRSGSWEETKRTTDENAARLHFAERTKHFPHSRWKLSKVELLEFAERIPRS